MYGIIGFFYFKTPTPLYFSYNIIVIFCYLPPKILRNQSKKLSVPRNIVLPPFPFILLSNPLHFQLFCDERSFLRINSRYFFCILLPFFVIFESMHRSFYLLPSVKIFSGLLFANSLFHFASLFYVISNFLLFGK